MSREVSSASSATATPFASKPRTPTPPATMDHSSSLSVLTNAAAAIAAASEPLAHTSARRLSLAPLDARVHMGSSPLPPIHSMKRSDSSTGSSSATLLHQAAQPSDYDYYHGSFAHHGHADHVQHHNHHQQSPFFPPPPSAIGAASAGPCSNSSSSADHPSATLEANTNTSLATAHQDSTAVSSSASAASASAAASTSGRRLSSSMSVGSLLSS
ncbi:hypothetical protein BC831DRAFT_441279 [Entophlyctis helioformis]|nr:hypothetical protein BC831DRAFT_441279 [Entophlyctis helioformis]